LTIRYEALCATTACGPPATTAASPTTRFDPNAHLKAALARALLLRGGSAEFDGLMTTAD
jgi:hypothetical protein